jgi:DNA polymerase-3 subunit gamma/tau
MIPYRVISLKYRPQNFDEITGQSHVVLSLKGAIKRGSVGHAFLFAGPRGVGKTTTARIFAKSLNCAAGPTVLPCQECPSCREITASRSIDVIEIDGASNRGIEEIRNLREGVKYSPLQGRFKIYIIDEVHMLTQEAFNALLKTLEEPPANVIFILATTNQAKIPATILSRCQRFIFKRLSLTEIVERLKAVAEKEKLRVTDQALYYLAVRADGSLRDAESILEQLASFIDGEIAEQDVFQLVGFLSYDFYFNLLQKITRKDLAGVIAMLNQAVEEGVDTIEIYRGFVNYLRKLFLLSAGLSDDYLELSADEIVNLKKVRFNRDEIVGMIEICLRAEESVKRSSNNRIALEIVLGQLASAPTPANLVKENPVVEKDEPPADPKSALVALLEKKSKKLAGIVEKSGIECDGKKVIIRTENEFLAKELTGNMAALVEALKKMINAEPELKIEIKADVKKDTDLLAEKIINMFDGEEVR